MASSLGVPIEKGEVAINLTWKFDPPVIDIGVMAEVVPLPDAAKNDPMMYESSKSPFSSES